MVARLGVKFANMSSTGISAPDLTASVTFLPSLTGQAEVIFQWTSVV